jgi:hypothetical protein
MKKEKTRFVLIYVHIVLCQYNKYSIIQENVLASFCMRRRVYGRRNKIVDSIGA